MSVRFTDPDGRASDVSRVTEPSPNIRVRWDRIAQLAAAAALIVIGWAVIWGMLNLAAEPLPPCTQATMTHPCSGATW